ncbi:DUF58 domain-containing protein [Robertmurraya massiliosenegalensis]|uniref:DUF58 domain-containing protein n=1 Tax=Robertmurraya TaxID=2837507 RepID=UPI0039A5D886
MRDFLNRMKHIWKLLVLLFLLVVTFSYAMFQGGFVSWFLFYSFLPFAVYSIVLVFFGVKQLTVKRELVKEEYHAGEKLNVKIKLKRPSSFPLFYMIIEDDLSNELLAPMQKSQMKAFVFPHFRKEIDFEYTIQSLPRGEHHLKGIHIRFGDPLGLVERQIHFETEDDKIIVYPPYKDLLYRPMDNHYEQGMTASKERVQRDTSMAIGIREYQPGDRYSWINWKASAKRNDIMTKEFEQRKSHDVLLIMDCAPEKRFEAIVSFTASLLRAILRKGAQVGLLTYSEERGQFPIQSGEAYQQQLFYHLAKIKDRSSVTLDTVLESESFMMWQNASIMLITSQLTRELVEKASQFSARKGSLTIFLIKEEKEVATEKEIVLKSEANARGVRVMFVHAGHFSKAFSEVNRG